MDPVTHALIGAAVYKISEGQISLSDPQLLAVVVGAVVPDIDIVLRKWGHYTYLKNHRGITHSLIGLTGLSLITTLIVSILYNSWAAFTGVYIFAMMGSLSHTIADTLNSYGDRALWPVIKRKLALNVLVLFDPIVFLLLLGIILLGGIGIHISLGILVGYMLFRIISKLLIMRFLSKAYNVNYKRIKVIPSVARLNRWHFVIKYDNHSVVGHKNIFKKRLTVIRRFLDTDHKMRSAALSTELGRFFKDFTPMYSLDYEKKNGENVFTFTDMRHCLRGDFMHHAEVIFTDEFVLKEQIFYPYLLNTGVRLNN